jgi:hypothetical protein
MRFTESRCFEERRDRQLGLESDIVDLEPKFCVQELELDVADEVDEAITTIMLCQSSRVGQQAQCCVLFVLHAFPGIHLSCQLSRKIGRRALEQPFSEDHAAQH